MLSATGASHIAAIDALKKRGASSLKFGLYRSSTKG